VTVIIRWTVFLVSVAEARAHAIPPAMSCSTVADRTRTAAQPHAAVDAKLLRFENVPVRSAVDRRRRGAGSDSILGHTRDHSAVYGRPPDVTSKRYWKKTANFADAGRDLWNLSAAVNVVLYTLTNGRR